MRYPTIFTPILHGRMRAEISQPFFSQRSYVSHLWQRLIDNRAYAARDRGGCAASTFPLPQVIGCRFCHLARKNPKYASRRTFYYYNVVLCDETNGRCTHGAIPLQYL